jgi:hypothetical protein
VFLGDIDIRDNLLIQLGIWFLIIFAVSGIENLRRELGIVTMLPVGQIACLVNLLEGLFCLRPSGAAVVRWFLNCFFAQVVRTTRRVPGKNVLEHSIEDVLES